MNLFQMKADMKVRYWRHLEKKDKAEAKKYEGKIASFEEYDKLRTDYEEDFHVKLGDKFGGREELIWFLAEEYHIADPDALIRQFELAGRDFNENPPSKMCARFIALMDFEPSHYSKRNLLEIGSTNKERKERFPKLIANVVCTQFFNSLTPNEVCIIFKREFDCCDRAIKKMLEAQARCQKSIDNTEAVIKRAKKAQKMQRH